MARAKKNPGARYARLLHFARRAGKREERRVEQDIVLTPFNYLARAFSPQNIIFYVLIISRSEARSHV